MEQQDDWAVLRVADEGEGLALESAERMFELFVQGERGLGVPQAASASAWPW